MTKRELPHAYVLELACDACDQQPAYKHRMFIAPNAEQAWDQALRIGGWRMRSGKLYCPSCAAGLRRRTR